MSNIDRYSALINPFSYDDVRSIYAGGASMKELCPTYNAKVVTICGSMRFTEKMKEQEKILTKVGYVVLMPIINDDKTTDEELQIYRAAHLQKIRMSDEIFVINKDGYIGRHTASEIEAAASMKKYIRFLENAENEPE